MEIAENVYEDAEKNKSLTTEGTEVHRGKATEGGYSGKDLTTEGTELHRGKPRRAVIQEKN